MDAAVKEDLIQFQVDLDKEKKEKVERLKKKQQQMNDLFNNFHIGEE